MDYPSHRICKHCGALKPIEEFALRDTSTKGKRKNRSYRRWICMHCTSVRPWIRKEEKRKEMIEWFLKELVRAHRRGRLAKPRSKKIVAALQKLCGSAHGVTVEWQNLCEKEQKLRPNAPMTIELITLPVALGMVLDRDERKEQS